MSHARFLPGCFPDWAAVKVQTQTSTGQHPAMPSASSSTPTVGTPQRRDQPQRRDHTADFKLLRGQQQSVHRDRAGPRLDWLLRILKEGDTGGMQHFVEEGQNSLDPVLRAGCNWCNARLSAPPTSGNLTSSDLKNAKVCQMCQTWHCDKCCSFFVNFTTDLRKPLGIVCCEPCHRRVEVLLWHMEVPPVGLSGVPSQLHACHVELSSQMTAMSLALAEFDQFSRSGHLGGELNQALSSSYSAANAAHGAVEGVLGKIAGITCLPPSRPGRPNASNVKLKTALQEHARLFLEDLKPRLRAIQRGLGTAAVRKPTVA